MRLIAIVFLAAVLGANAQSAPKTAPHKATAPQAPASAPTLPPQMSHDFRTAGRRAVAAIGALGRVCTGTGPCFLDFPIEYELKASKAINEADAQHDNAVDKQAVGLLEEYNTVAFDAVLDRSQAALDIKRNDWCDAGACEAMYRTCKKEAEEAFENGTMPAELQCRLLSRRDSKNEN